MISTEFQWKFHTPYQLQLNFVLRGINSVISSFVLNTLYQVLRYICLNIVHYQGGEDREFSSFQLFWFYLSEKDCQVIFLLFWSNQIHTLIHFCFISVPCVLVYFSAQHIFFLSLTIYALVNSLFIGTGKQMPMKTYPISSSSLPIYKMRKVVERLEQALEVTTP